MAEEELSTDEAILESIGEGASLDEPTTEETTERDNSEAQASSPEAPQADSGQSGETGTGG